MLKGKVFTWSFIVWMVLISVLSLVRIGDNDVPSLDIPYLDKMAHFVFHAVAAVIGAMALGEITGKKIGVSGALLRIIGFLAVYGIIIEVLQHEFTSWRSAEFADVVADILGALSGAVAVKLLYTRNWRLKWKN